MLLALSVLAAPGTADANRIDIDGPGETVTTICAAGGSTACTTPTTLKTSFATSPLVANFGFGAFSSLYIYNNGLVSIGAPIAPGANLSSLSTIGGNVFTAGYAPGMTLSNFTIEGPDTALFGSPGSRVVRVYYDASFGTSVQQMEFNIFALTSGGYELQFNHGDFDGDPIDFPANGYLGYAFGGNSVQVSGTTLQSQVRANADFAYFFPQAGAVPEPTTWAVLLTGFGAMGVALRRRRPAPARVLAR